MEAAGFAAHGRFGQIKNAGFAQRVSSCAVKNVCAVASHSVGAPLYSSEPPAFRDARTLFPSSSQTG